MSAAHSASQSTMAASTCSARLRTEARSAQYLAFACGRSISLRADACVAERDSESHFLFSLCPLALVLVVSVHAAVQPPKDVSTQARSARLLLRFMSLIIGTLFSCRSDQQPTPGGPHIEEIDDAAVPAASGSDVKPSDAAVAEAAVSGDDDAAMHIEEPPAPCAATSVVGAPTHGDPLSLLAIEAQAEAAAAAVAPATQVAPESSAVLREAAVLAAKDAHEEAVAAGIISSPEATAPRAAASPPPANNSRTEKIDNSRIATELANVMLESYNLEHLSIICYDDLAHPPPSSKSAATEAEEDEEDKGRNATTTAATRRTYVPRSMALKINN